MDLVRIGEAVIIEPDEFQPCLKGAEMNHGSCSDLICINVAVMPVYNFLIQYLSELYCTSKDDVRQTLADVSSYLF